MRPVLILSLPALLLAAGSTARAEHDIRAQLSPDGIDFFEDRLLEQFPMSFRPPSESRSFACATLRHVDPNVNIDMTRLDFSTPAPGRVRATLLFDGSSRGVLRAEKAIACLGSLTCNYALNIDAFEATFEYEVSATDGVPRLVARTVDFELNPAKVDVRFSGCSIGGVLTTATNFLKGLILPFFERKLEDIARDRVGPFLEDMIGGFMYEGSIGSMSVEANLNEILTDRSGLEVTTLVDVANSSAAAECVADLDPGDPGDRDGEAPDLSASNSHVGLAMNFGMLDDALYHAWRTGLTCLSEDHLNNLGVPVDLDVLAGLVPGFPAGTDMSLSITLTEPPRIGGTSSGGDDEIALQISGLELALVGLRPDGTVKTVRATLGAEVRTALGIDTQSNAIVGAVKGVSINELRLADDELTGDDGFDVAALLGLAEKQILPDLLAGLGTFPLSSATYRVGEYAVILREFHASEAYLWAGVDLYKGPDNDPSAPETMIASMPSGLVSPDTAVIGVAGHDAEIPAELINYQLTVNGVARPPTFLRELKVGRHGESGVYDVEIAALDLAGNMDAEPITTRVTVDGVSPVVRIEGARTRNSSGDVETLSWTMTDDMTKDKALEPRIEVHELRDPSDPLSAELVETIELERGALTADVPLSSGGTYRLEVHVVDKAGNDSAASVLLEVPSGGCSAAGRGSTFTLALAFLLLLATRRRRGRDDAAR